MDFRTHVNVASGGFGKAGLSSIDMHQFMHVDVSGTITRPTLLTTPIMTLKPGRKSSYLPEAHATIAF